MNKGSTLGAKSIIKALLLCTGLLFAVSAHSAQLDEYTLKLVYLYNFTKFVRWNDSTADDSSFRICVMGRLPAKTNLEKLNGKTSLNRPIAAVKLEDLADSGECHVLFVTKSISEQDLKRLNDLPLRDTLVVGETEDFALNQGDIGFVVDAEKHVRIEINLDHTMRKRLSVKAPLLEIARKVYHEEPAES